MYVCMYMYIIRWLQIQPKHYYKVCCICICIYLYVHRVYAEVQVHLMCNVCLSYGQVEGSLVCLHFGEKSMTNFVGLGALGRTSVDASAA
jgi:hypothetical protein